MSKRWVLAAWLCWTATATANPQVYEPWADPGLGFNLISWWNFGASGQTVWEDAVQDLYDHGFRHLSIDPVRYFDPATGAIAPSSMQGPELSHIGAAISHASMLGMSVTVNPFVEPENFAFWRGNWNPTTGSGISNAFWSDYQQYLVEVATLAQANGADYMTIGTELRDLTRNPGHNGSLILAISAVDAAFTGQLGYAANWDNFDHANLTNTVWENPAIDFMGVDAYFPLATNAQADSSHVDPNAFTDLVEANWNILLDGNILPFAQARKGAAGMPVVVTEHGLIPFNRTSVQPWSENPGYSQPVDQDEQISGLNGLITAMDQRVDNVPAIHLWQWGMPGADDSFWYLNPNGVQNQLGSKFDESLGNPAAQFLAGFVTAAAAHGDINGDDVVDVSDLALIGAQWGTAGSDPHNADISPAPNGDGIVDIGDLAVVGFNWSGGGSSSLGSASAGIVGLMLLGVVGLIRKRCAA